MKLLCGKNLLVLLALLVAVFACASEAYHKKHHDKKGYVKIKVWRGPSHGHKKHKYAPFGYHFSVDEKHH